MSQMNDGRDNGLAPWLAFVLVVGASLAVPIVQRAMAQPMPTPVSAAEDVDQQRGERLSVEQLFSQEDALTDVQLMRHVQSWYDHCHEMVVLFQLTADPTLFEGVAVNACSDWTTLVVCSQMLPDKQADKQEHDASYWRVCQQRGLVASSRLRDVVQALLKLPDRVCRMTNVLLPPDLVAVRQPWHALAWGEFGRAWRHVVVQLFGPGAEQVQPCVGARHAAR